MLIQLTFGQHWVRGTDPMQSLTPPKPNYNALISPRDWLQDPSWIPKAAMLKSLYKMAQSNACSQPTTSVDS